MPLVPKFSFVATSRNDDHGGDVLRRTQSFVDRLAEQCVRHRVHSELVLVDWNPPRSRKPLAEVLGWPAGSAWFSARVITVSPALHRRLECSRRLAMFQMIAKNVGIRRALGDYVIATNIDIIFSDALFEWLKSGAMREGVLYRSDRWDIPNEIQLEPDLDRLLQRARDEAIRHNLKDGTYVRRDGAFRNISAPRFDGSFYQPLENLLGGLRGSLADDDPVSPNKILPALDRMLSTDLPRLRREFLVPILHTNACGDFTMMAGHDWFALRGYPEWNIFSWHINSVIVYQAHYNNLQIGRLSAMPFTTTSSMITARAGPLKAPAAYGRGSPSAVSHSSRITGFTNWCSKCRITPKRARRRYTTMPTGVLTATRSTARPWSRREAGRARRQP